MKITSAEFILSAATLNKIPAPQLPEVAFIGRSNVGKSSLLNSLCNRKSLAKISSKPGKTRVLNFYRINNKFYFVDLPGYGYAKVPGHLRSGWRQLVEGYLKEREPLRLSFLIMDIRHDPMELDIHMAEWLEYYTIPYALVLTKADKVSRQRVRERIRKVERMFHDKSNCREIQPYSALSGEGKSELISLIKLSLDKKLNV